MKLFVIFWKRPETKFINKNSHRAHLTQLLLKASSDLHFPTIGYIFIIQLLKNTKNYKMPGLPDTNQQQLSLPVDVAEIVVGDREQPRQPHNLQGLLRFAMEAGATGPAAPSGPAELQPLDEENKSFLQEALKSMTVDVIAVMKENISKLQDVDDITDSDIPEKIEAFESILDYVDNVDIANDFHKINGFSIFEPCLECQHPAIRAKVCDLIAELAQNNPYIQEIICECTCVMRQLLDILLKDDCPDVKVKSLYAVSCITRESFIGYENFKMHEGILALRKALEDGNDKLRTKAAFLLVALHHMDGDLMDEMVDKTFLPVITYALNLPHQTYHEHLLSLLLLLMEESSNAKDCLVESNLTKQLTDAIQKILQFVRDKEEYWEEQETCEQLLRILVQ